MVALNDRVNGSKPPNPPQGESIFSAADILLQRRMRFNPLRALDPENLSIALDQFDIGILRQAALLWEAMCKRDDTLITIKPHLENSVASKDWGVFKKKGADETEASRHAACLGWFYDHVTATDAFDRNERGGRERLIEHMMRAESFLYAVQHLVWKPQPGKMIEVEGSAPVPVITAQIEYVPLWYFENTTGTLRFLPFGGFGLQGEELDWDNGEWMVTVGRGLMFAASICYVFKRLSFQDWTIFNERYAQNKVVGMTPASEESDQGRAFGSVVSHFNGDQAMVFYEMQPGEEPPIKLIGPTGTASVEIWEKFIERQDRKMSVMYRGSDLSMMSRGGEKEGDVRGASLQSDETEKMEAGCCRMIAGTLHHFIDRQVIRFCFGEGVEPLAYFGLPDMDLENTGDLRESAGFLADRGVKVKAASVADRLGVELAGEGEDALQPIGVPSPTGDEKAAEKMLTANSRERKAERLMQLVEEALRTANFDPDEPRDEGGKWTAREIGSLKDFLYKLKSDPNAHIQAPLGTLNPRTAARIRKAVGWDVDEAWVHADEFRHVQKNHPEIAEDDWHKLLDTIHSADDIKPSDEKKTKSGEAAVEVWKNDGSSWKFMVGTNPKGRNRLYVRTFKRRKEKP